MLGLDPDDVTNMLSHESAKKAAYQLILYPFLQSVLLDIFSGSKYSACGFLISEPFDRTCKPFDAKGVGIVLPGSCCAEV